MNDRQAILLHYFYHLRFYEEGKKFYHVSFLCIYDTTMRKTATTNENNGKKVL